MCELYKKYRPKTLKSLVGNNLSLRSISNFLEKGTLPHSLLFTGPSGCGKTTLARILKQKLNCSDYDFSEINCADFRGIDTVRDISRKMNMAPIGGNCRIWLIDECHKLSNDAQNAFLKSLEDTPGHVYFFLCTTDPDKLLRTIRTRCTPIEMNPLNDEEMGELITRICKREKISLPESAQETLIQSSLGSPRAALVLLDKIKGLPAEEMTEAAEIESRKQNQTIDLCRALISGKSWTEVAHILSNLEAEPEQVRQAAGRYACSVLLNHKTRPETAARAFLIIDSFRDPFWDMGQAKLAAACYEIFNG